MPSGEEITTDVVRDIDKDLAEAEIFKTMQTLHHGILGVRRFGQTNSVKITFSSKSLPNYVHMTYVRYSTSLYVARLLQCYQYNRMGHVASACERGATCAQCAGKHKHRECDSETVHCVHCGFLQGSVLSPALFDTVMSKLPHAISSMFIQVQMSIYADDVCPAAENFRDKAF